MARLPLKQRRKMALATLQEAIQAIEDLEKPVLAKMAPILAQAQHELEADLRAWLAKENGAARFTTQRYRNALVAVRRSMETIKRIEPVTMEGLRIGSNAAGVLSTANLETELMRFENIFEGTIRPVSIETAAVIAKGDTLLIDQFEASAKRYAGDVRKIAINELAVARVRGETIDELTTRLEKRLPLSWTRVRSNAERLARTETMNAYNVYHREGVFEAKKDDPGLMMRWDASYDRRRCPICASLDGTLIPTKRSAKFAAKWEGAKGKNFSAKYQQPPAHPNCFPGHVTVSGNFEAGLRANYKGPLVVLKTARGRVLPVTPHHPIATDRGFVPANELRHGDQVITDRSDLNFDAATFRHAQVNEDDRPASIAEVFDLLRDAIPGCRGVLTDDDLHGDARFCDGDVRIVRANREGWVGAFQFPDAGQDFVFVKTAIVQALHCCLRAFDFLGQRLFAAPGGGPGFPALAFDGGPTLFDTRPFQILSLGSAANLDAFLDEPATQDPAVDAKFIGQLLHRGAGQVSLDQIVEVGNVNYLGHVYDLQSPKGWIVAQGIVTSNCRCVLTPWRQEWEEFARPGTPPKKQERTTEALEVRP